MKVEALRIETATRIMVNKSDQDECAPDGLGTDNIKKFLDFLAFPKYLT